MTDAAPGIQEERLQDYDQWVVWQEEPREGGKSTKVLKVAELKPGKLKNASSTDPETWRTYAEARAVARRRDDVDGIGFVFSEDDPFVGIDLDSVYHYDNDEDLPELKEWAVDIVMEVRSYTELSPSGEGLHIYAIGKLPGRGRKRGTHDTGEIGMYDKGRFFTYTGQHAGDIPNMNPMPAQEAIEALYRRVFAPDPKPPKDSPKATDVRLSTDDVINKMMQAENSHKARALWQGDTSDYESASEADLALCSIIGFYTGPNSDEHIEEIFALSGLGKRGKWVDRDDYRQRTIAKALGSIKEFWTPERDPSRRSQAGTIARSSGPEKAGTIARSSSDAAYASDADTQETHEASKLQLAPAIPFPVEVMPDAVKDFITENTAALSCPPDLVAIPTLGVLSAGIGASRSIEVKRGFTQMASLFLAVVASPGGMKTPAASPAIRPLQELEEEYKAKYRTAVKDYESKMREYEVEKAEAKKSGEPAPEPPAEPKEQRSKVSDTTVEALFLLLEQNPRGLFVHRDELAGWVRAMDQYKGGAKGSDRQHWLSVYDGEPITVDRKGSESILVPKPFISLFGGIQPRMLGELGGGMEDGLMDRFLFGYPEAKIAYFSNDEPSRAAEISYENLYDSLTNLKCASNPRGMPVPRPIKMSFDALRAYEDEYNRISTDIIEPGFPSRLEAQWSKGRGYLARLSLIMGVCRCVWNRIPEDNFLIEREDVEKATALLRYFQGHARRVYGILEEIDPDELFAADLRDFLKEQDDHTWTGTPSDLHEELDARGIDPMPPDATRLSKKILELSSKNPLLQIKRTRGNKQRMIQVSLQDTIEPVGSSVTSVRSVTPDAPNGDATDASDAAEEVDQDQTE